MTNARANNIPRFDGFSLRSRRAAITLLAVCALAGTFSRPSLAQVTLSILPDAQSVSAGGFATYTLAVSGLQNDPDFYRSPTLGAFSVTIEFDPAVASVALASFGTNLDLSGDDYQVFQPAPGEVVLEETSFDAASALRSAQSSSFVLASFTVQGLSAGNTSLDFSPAPGRCALADESANSLVFDTLGSYLSVTGGPPPPPPNSLQAQVLGAGVILSWPTNAVGCALYHASDLLAPNWSAVTNTPALISQRYQVALPGLPTSQQFYRLMCP